MPQTASVMEQPPVESFYFAPIYTGIIVINPPEKKPKKPKEPDDAARPPEPRVRRDIAEILRGEENSRRSP